MCSNIKKEGALHTIRHWAGSKVRENIFRIQCSEKFLQEEEWFYFIIYFFKEKQMDARLLFNWT